MPPRYKTTPICAADVEEYIASTSDFQFEIDVFRYLRTEGWLVSHGGTYRDPITGKDRQYDIRARTRGSGACRIKLAVECKNLQPSFPLVVSRIPRDDEEAFHDLIRSAKQSRHSTRVTGKTDYFPFNGQVGKRTDQLGRLSTAKGELEASDKEVFEKLSQAVASAHGLIEETVLADPNPQTFFTAVLPIVVVPDGSLWVVDYDAEGNRQGTPSTASRCDVALRKTVTVQGRWNMVAVNMSHLVVYTLSGLKDFVEALKPGKSGFELLFPQRVIREG